MKTYDKSSLFANFLAKHNKEVRWRCIAKQWGSTNCVEIVQRMKKAAQYIQKVDTLKQIQSDLNFIKAIHDRNMKKNEVDKWAVRQLQDIIANLQVHACKFALKFTAMKKIFNKILDIIVYIFCSLFAAYIIINFA